MPRAAKAAAAAHHDAIHMPPNSWVPLALSLSMALTFVGFLIQPAVWIVGLVLVVVSLYAWYRGARTEFLELPE